MRSAAGDWRVSLERCVVEVEVDRYEGCGVGEEGIWEVDKDVDG